MIKFLKKNKGIAAGLFILTIIVCLAVFADFLTPYAFDTITLSDKLQPPSAAHIMGTDNFGRDIWTRVIYGARISLTVSLAAVALGLVLGCLLGLMGGYFKGPFDFALGRVMDIFMSFPSILLSLLIGIALGPSILNMCLSLGIPLIPAFYRVTRGAALNVGERTYVMAARSMGTKSSKILFRHILPNTLPQIFLFLSFSVGGSIMAESSLGYLGFGIPKPTPSWGLVISEGKSYIFNAPWIAGFSGLMIALTIFAFNLLGDGIRDYLDPKLK